MPTAQNGTTENKVLSVIGRPMPRVDGPLKVSGTATYTSDHNFPGMLYAVPVPSTIAKGSITALDASAAEKMPGVRAVFHRENIGRFFRVPPNADFSVVIDERRPPFDDDTIRYYGQYVAVAVAGSLQQAQAAADAVKVTYHEETPDVRTKLTQEQESKVGSQRGDAVAAFNTAPVKIDQTYVTPAETHNPIELHATVAVWDGTAFTLYESTVPAGPLSGGSMVTGSLVPAILEAAKNAIQKVQFAAAAAGPFFRQSADNLVFSNGRIHRKDQSPASGVPYEQVL